VDKVTITSADSIDIDRLLLEMRAADRAECEAYGFTDWQAMVRASAEESTLLWSAYDGEGLVSVFGVAPADGMDGYGAPWMLSTDRFDRHHRALVKTVPPYLAQMRSLFPRLLNWVYAENVVAVRWLQRIGFHVDQPQPFGLKGALFHRFYWEA
jgi:hypothetical protein